MTLTECEILEDLHRLVLASPLMQQLSGACYYDEDRPRDSQKEDLILRHTQGFANADLTEGYVTLLLYVPDRTDANGQSHRDGRRIKTLQRALQDFIDHHLAAHLTPIHYTLHYILRAYPETSLRQHFISAMLRYQYTKNT